MNNNQTCFMRATLLKRASRAFGQAHFVPQSRGAIVMVALLLAATNLFAMPTVSLLSGGPNPERGIASAGFVDGDITTDAEYHTPCGIAVDLSGNYLFVADYTNNAIRVLEFDINWTSTLLTLSTNGLNLVTNLFNHPIGVAIDSSYNLFVLNRGNGNNGNVLQFTIDDYLFATLVATNAANLTNAVGMALDFNNNIYVTIKSNKVLQITSLGVSNIVATVTNAGASLQGLVVKYNGLLAVCDSGRNGIYLINPTNGVVSTNAGFNGAGDFINTNKNSDPISIAKFFQPSGVAETGDGSLIVTDFGNNRVKVVTSTGVTNLYGIRSNYWYGPYPGLTEGDGTVKLHDTDTNNVQSRLPFGVVIAPDGSVYVTEKYWSVIRHVTGGGFTPPPQPPLAPENLAATAGYGKVFLTWTASASPGVTNYNIKRATSSGGPYTNNIIGSSTTTTYTDTNVADGATYYYVVSAVSSTFGEGKNSLEASATPMFSPVPGNLFVTNYNFGPVLLTWSTSAGATSYNVKRSTSTNGPFTTIASPASASYNDTSALIGTTYFYVVSAVNPGGESADSLEVSYTPPIPPPPAPIIGWFDYEPDIHNNWLTVLHPVSGLNYYTAHNDLLMAIDPTTNGVGVATYFIATNGPQPVLAVPSSANGSTPPFYQNGLFFAQSLPVTTVPDLVIKAVNVGPGGSSAIVTAEFIFQVANPTIIGNNGALFTVSDITTNVTLWYTIDGTDPTNASPSIGPIAITNGNPVTLSIGVSSNLLFRVRAFRSGYLPSGIAVQSFSSANFVPNTISFGFASGEASSDFVASPGQVFYAPVTFTALPSTVIYSLQFNITVTNLGPVPIPGLFWFSSMLEKPDPENPGFFLTIPTWAFVSSGTNPPPDNDIDYLQYQGDWYQNLQFTDGNLLGVGWVERYGATNLYITKAQDLITYSSAHDVLYPNTSYPNEVELGGYALLIPSNATSNDIYQIQIGRPSATSDGVGAPGSDVYIAAPTNGSTAGGSPINALKNITMGQIKYIVGSVYPFRWFNAGDFGSSNIVNADIEQVFEAAAYGLNVPLYASDFFDGMDSCGNIGVIDSNPADANYGYYTNTDTFPTRPPVFSYWITYTAITYDTNSVPISTNVTPVQVWQPLYLTTYYVNEVSTIAYIRPSTAIPPAYSTNIVLVTNTVTFPTIPASLNTLFDGDDTAINQIVFGDGVLDVCDVYVTFRRSLDPSLTWFRRFWNDGQRVADTGAPNVAAHIASKISSTSTSLLVAQNSATTSPQVNFTAGNIIGSAGQTVQIPINATIFGNYPLRVLMLNLNVTPLDGSPALTSAVQFTPNAALGNPYTTDSKGNGNCSAVWLNNTISGLTGTANIGTLTVTIPASATSLSAYAIHFDHASASPNGIASFPKQTLTGLITLSSRTNSAYGDGIPDLWRLRWFGTVNNILSISNACPSGDGINNWQKYVAGVDPNTPNDFPSLNPKKPVPAGATAAIHWPTVSGKQYVILRSGSLFPGSWSAIATNTGTGTDMEFDDTTTSQTRFYRVQILP
jgi:hypothetical protein